MTKRPSAYALMLPSRDPGTPAYRWLYAAVRAQILEGRLRPGARLPGTRDLGGQYGLSRGTVVSAFGQLEAEGYVEGSVGSGTYVSQLLPEELLQVRAGDGPGDPRPAAPRRRLSGYARRVTPFPVLEARPTRAFRCNLPALDLFPTTLWAQVATRRLRRASTRLLLGCEAMGYAPLREAVADYLVTSRGVRCRPEEVAIVTGIQEALELAARLFLDPGDRVAVEDPGYPGAAHVFEALGARVSPVSLDAEGLDLEDPGLRGARLVYVTPAHQFPLGTTMSLRRRLGLLDWARKAGALVLEDDYDSEYRYSGRPVPALQGLDRNAQVLFAGTFNKVLFPSLRLGYLVVPADLVERFETAKSVASRHPPLLDQAVLCDFIVGGHFGRHLRSMREVYAERFSVFLEAARGELAGLLEISPVEAGLQTTGWLLGDWDGEGAARAAAARGVEVTPLGRGVRELAAALVSSLPRSRKVASLHQSPRRRDHGRGSDARERLPGPRGRRRRRGRRSGAAARGRRRGGQEQR
jgi:GntR family transcriptional regulator / MocR family aminotransferase